MCPFFQPPLPSSLLATPETPLLGPVPSDSDATAATAAAAPTDHRIIRICVLVLGSRGSREARESPLSCRDSAAIRVRARPGQPETACGFKESLVAAERLPVRGHGGFRRPQNNNGSVDSEH